MKEKLNEILSTQVSTNLKLNLLREYFQHLILKIIYDKKISSKLSFVGGTALSILYNVGRFSEDLDFSLSNKNKYNVNSISKIISNELGDYGFINEVSASKKNIVNSIWFRFPDILNEYKISLMEGQKLSIKLEIDTNPPKGFEEEIHVVNKYFFFTVRTYKIDSLFAGKLHAFLFRKYSKGRDYYDLLWYLSKKIVPNWRHLINSAFQTEKRKLKENELFNMLVKKFTETNYNQIRREVLPFLQNPSEVKDLSLENFLASLKYLR